MGLIGLTFIGGTIGLLLKNAAGLVFDGDTALGVATVAVVVLVIPVGCLLLIRKWLAARKKRRIRQSLLKKVYVATQEHLSTLCAEELRQAGWNAQVALQSRDQGVDVIAEKNGIRVVLQCKLYAGPVDNNAVQEAVAGRAHEKADYAVVVTDDRSTSAAEPLAATNGVLLLHYGDLRNLEQILPSPIGTHNRSVLAAKRESRRNSPVASLSFNFDRARWDALLKRDPQLSAVADKLRPLGEKWVDKFAASYLAASDSLLPALVSGIIAQARKEFEQEEAARRRRALQRK